MFKKRVSKPIPPPDWEVRVEKLERRMNAVEMDWEEWFDKFRRLYGRLSKRISDAKKTDEVASGPTNGPRVTNPLARRLMGGE